MRNVDVSLEACERVCRGVTYFARSDVLTHQDLVLGGKFRGVVVYVFDFDVDTDFGVLVMSAWPRQQT